MTKGKISQGVIVIGLTICFSFCMPVCFAQSVQTNTGKKDILIGEQIPVTIKLNYIPKDYKLQQWLAIPDSVSHFEIVEVGKIDSTGYKDNSKLIQQTIIITSFDSGKWVFPSLPIKLAGVGGQSWQLLQTDSFYVNVSYSPADSTNQLRDIKPIIKVTIFDFFWVYIAGAAVLLLLIIYLLYRYYKKKKNVQPGAFVSKLSPFDEAMEALKNLGQYNLQDAADIKKYHIGLATIFKHYLGRKQNKLLLNKTTGDILVGLSNKNFSTENISNLATALRCTDAVKFAKYLPLPNESEDCMQKLKETIYLNEAAKLQNTKH